MNFHIVACEYIIQQVTKGKGKGKGKEELEQQPEQQPEEQKAYLIDMHDNFYKFKHNKDINHKLAIVLEQIIIMIIKI